jgi:transcriptional regulator with XRE-family HTH domain
MRQSRINGHFPASLSDSPCEDKLPSPFGLRLREAIQRKYGPRKQTYVAALIGVQSSDISEWIYGRDPRLDALAKLSEVLDVSLEWLITGKERRLTLPQRPTDDFLRDQCHTLIDQMPDDVVSGLAYYLQRNFHWAKTGDDGLAGFMRGVRGEGR